MNAYAIATTDLATFDIPPICTSAAEAGIREETTRFDNALGQGCYHDIYLADIHIGYGNLHPARALRLNSQQTTPVVEMHFLLEGTCVSYLDSLNSALVFQAGQSNVLFLPGQQGSYHELVAGQTCREFEVHLSGPFFQRLAQSESGPLAELACRLNGTTAGLLQPQHIPVTGAMRVIMQQIMDCPLRGVARRLLLEAKVVELLALQLAHIYQQKAGRSDELHLRSSDVEKLRAAQTLLVQDLSYSPTLAQLAAACGLNEFKLKKGFKQLFGKTVYGYLLHCRMERALVHLREGDMTVAEVAEAVGYRYSSHFAAAFKKQYGMLPKAIWG